MCEPKETSFLLQNARIMAAAAAVGASNGTIVQKPSGLLPSMGSGGVVSSSAPSVPQSIPGREIVLVSQAYDVGTNGAYSGGSYPVSGNNQSGGGSSIENGPVSRSVPSSGPINPVPVNPDLLPMIKEIWSKPGAA